MSENPDYLTYVENLLGEHLTADNGKLVESLPVRRLNAFRENHHQAYHTFTAYVSDELQTTTLTELTKAPSPHWRRPASAGEFRPMLHGRLLSLAYTFGGDEGHPWLEDNEKRLLSLKRLLLYAHSIVIADPLWYINQFLGVDREEQDEFLAMTRKSLCNYFNFLYQIRELIRSGIVLFYPQFEHTNVGFSKYRFDDPGFLKWYRTVDNDHWNNLLMQVRSRDMIELLFYCVRYGASCFVDSREYSPALEFILRYGRTFGGEHLVTANDEKRMGERRALSILADVALPSLEKLSMNEIVAVRKSSDGFEQFRASLREGLLRIDSGAVATNEQITKQAVQDSLAEGRSACDKEIRRSSFLQLVKQNGANFAVGAAAGLMMGDPTGGLGTGALTAALTVLKDYIGSRSEVRTQRALARHYALWYQTDS